MHHIQFKNIEATQREFIKILYVAPFWRRLVFAAQIVLRIAMPEGFKWYEPTEKEIDQWKQQRTDRRNARKRNG